MRVQTTDRGARRATFGSAKVLGRAAVVAATLAAGLAAGVPAEAVGGGTAATGDALRFAVKLDVGEVRSCSGALVAPSWVVTAASCFPENGGAVGPPKIATTATVGRTDLTTGAGHVLSVYEVVPHPQRNLVLARLAEPVTDVPPVKIATTPPATGDVLRVAGYGRTSTEWVPSALHTALVSVGSVAAGTFDITGKTPPEATLCKGDVGGPALRETAAGIELVALHHTSWQGGCYGSTSTKRDAVETRVDDLGGWIAERTVATPAVLYTGQTVRKGASLISGDGRFELVAQNDGNLVTYERYVGAIWASNTPDGAHLDNQADGNLVLYRADGTAAWSTGTYGKGPSTLWVQDDGNVVLYRNSDGAPLWSTVTGGHVAVPAHPSQRTDRLASGQAIVRGGLTLQSADSRFTVNMQASDGNVVLRQGIDPLWATGGGRGSFFVNQNDGNLVIYASNGTPLWDSKTGGKGPSTLIMQNDGNFVLYRNSDGVAIWETRTCCR